MSSEPTSQPQRRSPQTHHAFQAPAPWPQGSRQYMPPQPFSHPPLDTMAPHFVHSQPISRQGGDFHYPSDWSADRRNGAHFEPTPHSLLAPCTHNQMSETDLPIFSRPCNCPPNVHDQMSFATAPTPPPSDNSGHISPHAEWAAFAAPEVDYQPDAKRLRYSTLVDTNSPVLRPDGVRKKNAKFEIPDDRNLSTLDSLIKHAKTDEELKEFKMQKRLLRNREAALHSRQKKKTHTEKLEKENQELIARMQEFQLECHNLHAHLEEERSARETWQTQFQQEVAKLRREREEMLKEHAKEKQALNTRISSLAEQLQHAHSAHTSSTSTGNSSADMGECGMGFGTASEDTGEWSSTLDMFNEPTYMDPDKLHSTGVAHAEVLVQ